MSYFLIMSREDGTKIEEFSNKDHLKEYLENFFTDEPVKFLESIPEDFDDFFVGEMMVIKGEVVMPKPVSIVKTYEVE